MSEGVTPVIPSATCDAMSEMSEAESVTDTSPIADRMSLIVEAFNWTPVTVTRDTRSERKSDSCE